MWLSASVPVTWLAPLLLGIILYYGVALVWLVPLFASYSIRIPLCRVGGQLSCCWLVLLWLEIHLCVSLCGWLNYSREWREAPRGLSAFIFVCVSSCWIIWMHELCFQPTQWVIITTCYETPIVFKFNDCFNSVCSMLLWYELPCTNNSHWNLSF